MMFNGVFNDLTAEQAVALLSCFVLGEKAEATGKATKEELAAPLRVLQVRGCDVCDCVCKISLCL